MLVDSFRPGKMSTASWSLFVLLAVAMAVLPTPAHWVTRDYHIPTGSMQPTLNGILAYPSDQEPPASIKRLIDFVVSGRNYINVVSKEDDEVNQIIPYPHGLFFQYSKIVCRRQTFLVRAPAFALQSSFHVARFQAYRAGDVIARGAIGSGDQIFTDTLIYRFHGPRRGDLVVFSSDGIAQIPPDPLTGPVINMKRIAGLPGDVLRIDPPLLYVNGSAAQEEGLKRVMSGANGYRGYCDGREYLVNATDAVCRSRSIPISSSEITLIIATTAVTLGACPRRILSAGSRVSIIPSHALEFRTSFDSLSDGKERVAPTELYALKNWIRGAHAPRVRAEAPSPSRTFTLLLSASVSVRPLPWDKHEPHRTQLLEEPGVSSPRGSS